MNFIKRKLAKYMLVIGTQLICRADIEVIEDNAYWDEAQNAMERIRGNPIGLLKFARRFDILASRARERSTDLKVEMKFDRHFNRRKNTVKQMVGSDQN